MTDINTDRPLEKDSNAEEVPPKSESRIPEGYVEDDYIPSVFLEDIGEDKEVWLLDCPDTIDLKTLLGKELNFSNKKYLITNEGNNEKCVFVPEKDKYSVSCLLYSCTGDKLKTVAIQSEGNIRLNVGYDIPELGSMMDDDPYVPFPKGLKVRHPFLSQVYNSVSIENELSTTDNGQGFTSPKKMKKKIQLNPTDDVPTSRESLKETKNREILSPKKSKKRKRESSYENPEELTEVIISEEHYHTSKKLKKENVNADEDGYANNIMGPRLSNIESELNLSSKKKKKKHSHLNESGDYYVTAEEIQTEREDPQVVYDKSDHRYKHQRLSMSDTQGQELEIISEGNEHISKKAKRKSELRCKDEIRNEKDGYANNIMGPRLSNIESELNLSSKKKKKKHSHLNESGGYYVTAEEIQIEREDPQVVYDKSDHRYKHQRLSMNDTQGQELEIISEGNEHISKKAKRKSELRCKDEIRNEKDGYSSNIMALGSSNMETESGISKRKKKKKHLVSDEDVYTMTEESIEEKKEKLPLMHNIGDGVFSKLVKREKFSPLKASRLSMNPQEDGEFSVVNEGNDLNSKKKSKKISIKVKSEDTVMTVGDSQEENLSVVYDESARLHKKKKKPKGKDSLYEDGSYIASEDVDDEVLSFDRNSIPFQKIEKKKHSLKKKDSLLLTEDYEKSVNLHYGSDRTSSGFKKEKKWESNFRHDDVLSESFQEEVIPCDDGERTLKNTQKKRHSVLKANASTLDSQENSDAVSHESEQIFKKVKKAKVKESQYKDDIVFLSDTQEEATASTYDEVAEKVSKKIKKKKDSISALEALELEANIKDAVRDNLSFEGIKKEKKPKKRRRMENAGDMNASGVDSILEEDPYIGLWVPQENH